MYSCEETAGNQLFFLTGQNEIRNYDVCMDAASINGDVKTLQCHLLGGNQQWKYDEQVRTIRFCYNEMKFKCSFFST